MGCGATKLENFEGPPDEEIQFHAKSILLAAQSGEKGNGPETRVIHALNGILKAMEPENAIVYPTSLHKLSSAIESLRLEAGHIHIKYLNEINDARIAACKRIIENPEESDPGGREVKNWGTLKWIPRVVSLEPTNINLLGNSIEYGITGPGAASLGFCVEAWVFNNKTKKQPEGNLFQIIDLSNSTSNNKEIGMSPSMYVDDDSRPVLDFYKKQCISTKSDVIPINEWCHIAYVYGSEQMKIYVNGIKVGIKEGITPPMGQVSLQICSGNCGFITEMRLWMCERTEDEIKETMNKSITPFLSKNYPSLRLCWMPISKGSPLYSSGSLLYDVWRQTFTGSRNNISKIIDSRWPSALPLQLIPDQNYLYASHYCDEISDSWEKFHVDLFVNQPIPSKYKPELSIVETKALQIMNIMLEYGGPWIPRIVCFAPNTSICIGTTDELGISGQNTSFTIECWIRIRILNPNGNTLIEYGKGDSYNENQLINIYFKNGCPVFTLCGQTIESDVGLPIMKWTHLAFVFDSRHQQIYANGTLIASTLASPLINSNTIIIGSNNSKNTFTSDLCELRLWNRALSGSEISEYMLISIPPLGGKGHRNLKLTWLPLRNGGPVSQETWCRRKLMLTKLNKSLSHSSLKYLNRPVPTIFWDVQNMRDCGTFINIFNPLLTSRTRYIHIPHFIPTLDDLPQSWSKSAVAVIDEWTDIFDRAYVPKWYEVPQVNEADHEAFSQVPTNASEAVTKIGTWIGRVMRTRTGCNYSIPIGLTAELGLCGIATGGREFTLELWIKTKGCDEEEIKNKKIIFEDIFGHEDKESNESTGFFGMGSPYSLRIGLANGYPFMNFLGQIKSLKASDLKEGVISSTPIPPNKWTHLAFVAIGDGKILLYINGEEVCRRERMNPLQAKGDTMIHAFGYEDRLLKSDICEMRMWSCARNKDEILDGMSKCFPPLPTGLPRIPELRLAWFPTNSMKSVFWDHKYIMIRGVYEHLLPEELPKYTRRPLSLPPSILTSLINLPPAYVLDDRGDSYERNLSTNMLPPVVRFDDGSIYYNHYDKSFEPLAKKSTHTFASVTISKEDIDLGWCDTDDGQLLSHHLISLDDGGWMECWDKETLAKFQEEEDAVDVSKFVPPMISRPVSRTDLPLVASNEIENTLNKESHEITEDAINNALQFSYSEKLVLSPPKLDESRSNVDEIIDKSQDSPVSVVDSDIPQ